MKRNKCVVLLLCILTAISSTVAAFAASDTQVAQSKGIPVVRPLEATTFTEIAIEVTLSATDADNDVLLYQLTEAPRLGEVRIEGTTLYYTPGKKTGTDKFSYTAVDAEGNTAKPAAVSIKIQKNKGEVTTYADLTGNACHYAALALSQEGIMRGEQIGDCSFFRPTQTVTRSEFILMVSKICGYEVASAATTTFLDDAGLSDWAKPYISTASQQGIVSGYPVDGTNAVIRGENPITIGEACMILQNVLSASEETAVYTMWQEHSALGSWDSQAISTLSELEIIPSSLTLQDTSQSLVKQDASIMLYNFMQLL